MAKKEATVPKEPAPMRNAKVIEDINDYVTALPVLKGGQYLLVLSKSSISAQDAGYLVEMLKETGANILGCVVVDAADVRMAMTLVNTTKLQTKLTEELDANVETKTI